jgi:hypothetical protein
VTHHLHPLKHNVAACITLPLLSLCFSIVLCFSNSTPVEAPLQSMHPTYSKHLCYAAACLQALCPSARSSIAAASGAAADILLRDNDSIKVGSLQLRVIATPGHTSGCLCFYLPPAAPGGAGLVFTGDALLIRGCGRTDFQQGEAGSGAEDECDVALGVQCQ